MLLVEFSLIVRFPVPVTPPVKISPTAVTVKLLFKVIAPLTVEPDVLFGEIILNVLPLLPEATVIGLANVNAVPVGLTDKVAFAVPLVSPMVIAPVPEPPKALVLVAPFTSPALMVKPPVKVFTPERVSVPAPVLFMPKVEPLIMPDIVKVPEATLTVYVAPSATGAEIVAVPPMIEFEAPDRVTAVAPEIMPAVIVRSPVTVIPLVLVAMVILALPSVTFCIDTPAESIVTVPVPELASKMTLSPLTGRLPAPGAPPDVAAQWVAASDQLPVPATQ